MGAREGGGGGHRHVLNALAAFSTTLPVTAVVGLRSSDNHMRGLSKALIRLVTLFGAAWQQPCYLLKLLPSCRFLCVCVCMFIRAQLLRPNRFYSYRHCTLHNCSPSRALECRRQRNDRNVSDRAEDMDKNRDGTVTLEEMQASGDSNSEQSQTTFKTFASSLASRLVKHL